MTIKKTWVEFINFINLLNMISQGHQNLIQKNRDKTEKRTPEEHKLKLEQAKELEDELNVFVEIGKHFEPTLKKYNEDREWIEIDTAMVSEGEAAGTKKGALLRDEQNRLMWSKEGERDKRKRFDDLANQTYDFPVFQLSADKTFYAKKDDGKVDKSTRRYTFMDGFVIFDKPALKAVKPATRGGKK